MGFANSDQLRALFLCGGMGFLLGVYYDVFRLFRLWPTAPTALFFQDCAYCVSSAVAVYLFSLAVTDGRLRLFLFVGLVGGFFSYRYTVGRCVVRTIAVFRRQARRLWRFLEGKRRALAAAGKNYLKKSQKNQKKA